MLNILIRQAKVNISLENYVHAKVVIKLGNKKTSVSSIDITSTSNVNIIEFNSSCEILGSAESSKVEFSILMTDKSVDTINIGSGSTILLPSDHGSTKFVYLYDLDKQSAFIATLTYTVFFHDPPVIDVAEKNLNRLRNNVAGTKRVLNTKELSFLLKRRLHWLKRGPYPASFDYKTEKQLDREMMMVYGRIKRDESPKYRTKFLSKSASPLKTSSSSPQPIPMPIPIKPETSSPPLKSRRTQMKVGYVGVQWPEVALFEREKLLYSLYLAEERRLKRKLEISKQAARMRGVPSTATSLRIERNIAELLDILEKKDTEIDQLRRSLVREKVRAIQNQATRSVISPKRYKQMTGSFFRETDASRQRRLSTYHIIPSSAIEVATKSSMISKTSNYNKSNDSTRIEKKSTRIREAKKKSKKQVLGNFSSHLSDFNVSKPISVKRNNTDPIILRNHSNNNNNDNNKDEEDEEKSVDTTDLVKRFNEAFSFARDKDLGNVDEELDDTLSEYQDAKDLDDIYKLNASLKRRSAISGIDPNIILRKDWLSLANNVIENISNSNSSIDPGSSKMDNVKTHNYKEVRGNDSIMTSSTTKFNRFDEELMDFGNDLNDVKDRVEALTNKMTSIQPFLSNSTASTSVTVATGALGETEVDISSIQENRDTSHLSGYSSNDSNNASRGNKKRTLTSSSPVEKALVKSMEHLSAILARLQAHDSLLSANSSPSKSPSKT